MNAHDFDVHSDANTEKEAMVSIIVLNFNGQDLLSECLRSVFKTNYNNYEVIVVDNGSSDRSCDIIKRDFKKVRLIENPDNYGYSGGNNIGILQSKGQFVVLLNNDIVVHADWLHELVQEAKEDPRCFYQPKMLFAGSQRINSAGNIIQLFGFGFPRGIGESDVGQYDQKCELSYASGACVLASRKLIKDVGLLDEYFFDFYEDVNWGWRALMQGYRSVYIPSAVVYHRWGGTWGKQMSSRKFLLIERSRLATVIRNYSSDSLACMLPAFLVIELMVIAYSLRKGFMSEKVRAYSDVLRLAKILREQKRKMQATRKKPDKLVVERFSDGIDHPYIGESAAIVSKLLTLASRMSRYLIR